MSGGEQSGLVEDGRNALRMRDRELRARLEVGREYVRPGGIWSRDRRYVARFLELLGEYEEVQDRRRTCQRMGKRINE